jgi:hypothetical protein
VARTTKETRFMAILPSLFVASTVLAAQPGDYWRSKTAVTSNFFPVESTPK